ncbi:MAG: phage tail sheath C-terminal domain-containing protein [Actinomycetota bacterium]
MTGRSRLIEGVKTSIGAFVGDFARGPADKAVHVSDLGSFERRFGGPRSTSEASYAVRQFFGNGGAEAWVVRVKGHRRRSPDAAAMIGSIDLGTGMQALRDVGGFNILCIPDAARLSAGMVSVYESAVQLCESEGAFLIVDIGPDVTDVNDVKVWLADLGITSSHAAAYFPRILVEGPLDGFKERSFGASGTMAGVYARTDAEHGVWKAPAGVEAQLRGVHGLSHALTDAGQDALNRLGVNGLRRFPVHGEVAWGARTLDGADSRASEWKYVPVRRFALFLEESLYRGTEWAVFEPNDEPLWSELRATVETFMRELFGQGAFPAATPRDAYFVRCDRTTTTQGDIDAGIVNIVVGFAPLKPAEFIILRIQQNASPDSP